VEGSRKGSPSYNASKMYSEEDIGMASVKPALKLWRLIQSHRVTAVIYVAAKLG